MFLLVAWGSGVQVGDADEIDGFFLWTQHSSTGPLDSTAAPMGILKARGGEDQHIFRQNLLGLFNYSKQMHTSDVLVGTKQKLIIA